MSWHIETKCIQEGWKPKDGEARVLPIYQSTTFRYESAETMGALFDLQTNGDFYTRLSNPTTNAVEAKIAALEGGVGALMTSAGQAASLVAVLNITHHGDHIISTSAIYGGTFNLFQKTMGEMGIDVSFVDPNAGEDEICALFRPNTKLVFGETLSNPSLCVLDIEKFARIAHAHQVPLIVDNTFPTPINCRPFEFGADIVTHSTSKYLDGHAVALGGVVVDSGNFDWAASGADDAGQNLPWRGLYGAFRESRLHCQMPCPSDARSRRYPQPAKRLPAQPGHRYAASAYGAALRQRPEGRGIFDVGRPHHLGLLPRSAGQSLLCAGTEIYAERHLRRHLVRHQRWT